MSVPVALVTGAGKRLGRKVAVALASEGYDIAVHYHTSASDARTTERAVLAEGRRCVRIRADLRQPKQVQRVFSEVRRNLQRIDLVVNNAAIFPIGVPFVKMTPKQWDDAVRTNLTSVVLCCQQAVRHMQRTGGGHIINIASLGAFLSWKNHIHYNISKAGVVSLTLALAKTLAPEIRVNAVAPGTIIVPQEETTDTHLPAVEKIPLKRYGKPDDIIQAVLFLARSNYLTGEVIRVDGGVTLR